MAWSGSRFRPYCFHIHGIWQHRQTGFRDSKLTGEFQGHCRRLADDTVRTAVKQPVEQARVAANIPKGLRRCKSAILANQYACPAREKRAQQQHQQVQMRHAGENNLRLEPPNQAQQRPDSEANPGCAEGVEAHGWRHRIAVNSGLGNKAQVHLVLGG